jgi:hypothetical protein
MCLLKYVLNCEQHFWFFIFRSGLTTVYYISKYYQYLENGHDTIH